jgi:hypothetical protein
MKNFRDFQVWRKAHQLVLTAYKLTLSFPREEINGLTSQIRRCAVSIGTNIVKGCGKTRNHRVPALFDDGSWVCQFLLARDLNILSEAQYRLVTIRSSK